MKHLTLLKNCSDEAFNASSPRFIPSSLSTLYEFMQKYPHNSAGLTDSYIKAKTMKFISCTTKNTGIKIFRGKIAKENHCFVAFLRYYFVLLKR
jgi:hypothetical protein